MTKFRLGYWLSTANAILAIIYLLTVLGILLFDQFPPSLPYQSGAGWEILASAPLLIWLWVVIYETVPAEKHILCLGSLSMMIIFGTLTSLNRYVSLTVIPQAQAIGKTDGLDWFQTYNWPSVMAAVEYLAWGFFLGLAFICLAPVFKKTSLERFIFGTLIVSGIFCLMAALGLVIDCSLLTMLGFFAWGPGLITILLLLARWFKQQESVFSNGGK